MQAFGPAIIAHNELGAYIPVLGPLASVPPLFASGGHPTMFWTPITCYEMKLLQYFA